MGSAQRVPLAVIVLGLVASSIGACTGQNDGPTRGASYVPTEPSPMPGTERARRAVLNGAKRDFAHAVGVPPGFEECFLSRFSHKLTPSTLRRVFATHARRGEAAAARQLNGLGAALGDSCGDRRWVPQLTAAATGLRSFAAIREPL